MFSFFEMSLDFLVEVSFAFRVVCSTGVSCKCFSIFICSCCSSFIFRSYLSLFLMFEFDNFPEELFSCLLHLLAGLSERGFSCMFGLLLWLCSRFYLFPLLVSC